MSFKDFSTRQGAQDSKSESDPAKTQQSKPLEQQKKPISEKETK